MPRPGRQRPALRLVLAIAITALLVNSATAQEVADKKVRIVQAPAPPTIDGQLSPGEWDGATIISDLHQVAPVEYSTPSQETVWYLMYDARALYVAAVAYDNQPGQIAAQELRQGSDLENDDTLRIIVDAFNSKRRGYSFAVNPNGVREDGIYTSGTLLSKDWDGIWRTAARTTPDGWRMEMAIPFNTLTFDPDNDTWGVNLSREIKRNGETVAWSSRNGNVDPTVSGELQGFRDLDQGLGLDIIPSLSLKSEHDHQADNDASDFKPSLDVNYKLTPAISMLLTLNTDFAGTEVDSRDLGLRRFSPVFPEKRSFFLTDFDIFQFGGISTERARGPAPLTLIGSFSEANAMPFFSRRIGLAPSGDPVDLIGGFKISGGIGSTDFGVLYVRQDEYDDIEASDLFIARVATDVLSESSVGAIVTSGDPWSNDSSSLAGLDFHYLNTRLANNRSLEGQFWVQKSDNEGVSGKDWAYSAALGVSANEGWEGGFQVHEAQENFRPALGFANRTGVRMYSGVVRHKWIFEDSRWFQRVDTNVDYTRWDYLDNGQLQTELTSLNLVNIYNSSDDSIRTQYYLYRETLREGDQPLARIGIEIPAGRYSFNRHAMTIETAGYRRLSTALRFDNGDFYNGRRLHVRSTNNWRVSKHLSFTFVYDHDRYEFPGVKKTVRLLTFNNTIAFNAKWSLLTIAQYDNISDDIGINMRLRYNQAAGRDFWLVLNHNFRKYTEDDPEYRSGGFRSVQTDVTAKVLYTFRF